jgi:hypothetical protein
MEPGRFLKKAILLALAPARKFGVKPAQRGKKR